jgi:electron-transferring-flavoprotein dehydrogenase
MTPRALLDRFGPRETMPYDVVIVGAGPAGLATAIRLKQLAQVDGKNFSVAVLEKGSEPGAHILSGAVMDPRALTELFPDWMERGAPLNQEVTQDRFLFLTESGAKSSPVLPDCFTNHGNYIVSLGEVVKWMAGQAEALGVEIFPGFAAAEVLYDERGAVRGVATGNLGLDRHGEPMGSFQLGVELTGKYTVFAEGSRGHLGRQLIAQFNLDAGCNAQVYGIGLKELWEIDVAQHQPGLVLHTAGWPLDGNTYGGSFLYHAPDRKVALGFVVGLDYANPHLSPFEEFQRWKTHPSIRPILEGGKRLSYGARTITAGGILSLPKQVFPGGALVGCEAGYLNASRIKGVHAAMKSGMLCAESMYAALAVGQSGTVLDGYPEAFRQSWLHAELMRAKNFKQWFKKGRAIATVMTGVEQWLLPRLGMNRPPWTLRSNQRDHEALRPANACRPIAYPKPDGVITFDRLSSVFVANVNHAENQPAHLTLKDAEVPVKQNLATYAGPESRYCPAGVYEFVKNQEGRERLQINAQNCVHCKTCDVKDPTQNIVWVTPEGGGGPNYAGM